MVSAMLTRTAHATGAATAHRVPPRPASLVSVRRNSCIKPFQVKSRGVAVRAKTEQDPQVEVDKFVRDLQDRWDATENKPAVVVYGVGAVVALWFASTLVSAINGVPLVPKLMELVGLGYTSWFVYRYLLFKSSREELRKDVEELKKRIAGSDLPKP